MDKRKLIYIVGGARPNFMKIAPIVRALETSKVLDFKIIHTGQHYDKDMNEVFFDELNIPEPDYYLSAGGGSHSEQTCKIMLSFEKICENKRPDAVLVVGDVNSTLACSIVSKKMNIKLIHVEAGLRSYDRTMPEEINRIVTDSISDIFFVTETSGVDNLLSEGKPENTLHYVGHVMIDNLLFQLEQLNKNKKVSKDILNLKAKLTSKSNNYGILTLHRPGNVDNKQILNEIIDAINEISKKLPIIFSVHPRTKKQLDCFNIKLSNSVTLIKPQSYMNFLFLWKDAELVLTDSGGLQEETTALGVPCITIRENTERPITIKQGTNVLAGTSKKSIVYEADKVISGYSKSNKRPDMWDGKAAHRIVKILQDKIS